MLAKILLLLLLTLSVSSLDCNFEVKVSDASTNTNINVHDGRDTCSGDDYCVKVEYDGLSQKGCWGTLNQLQLTDIVCQRDECVPSQLNDLRGTFCCCKGNRCNGAAGGTAILMTVAALGATRILLNF